MFLLIYFFVQFYFYFYTIITNKISPIQLILSQNLFVIFTYLLKHYTIFVIDCDMSFYNMLSR